MADKQAVGDSVTVQDIWELSQFQILLLVAVRSVGPATGADIRRAMEDMIGEDLVKSRFYNNLRDLSDEKYLRSKSINRRAEEWRLTDEGEELLALYSDTIERSTDN